MILISHIIIALTSLALAAYALFRPSKKLVNTSYIFTSLTFVSGFYLIYLKPSTLTQMCAEGLVFLGIMTAAIGFAKHRLKQRELAKQNI